MKKDKISAKQREVLDYLESQIMKKGYPPSVREICQAVGLSSTSSVHAHLNSLERKGYIRRDPTKPRAIEILEPQFKTTKEETVSVPVVGKVAAGLPILAVQHIDSYFPVARDFLPATTNDLFVLQVKGESMINVGIYDGDLLIVESQKTAKNGEIIVALVDDSATVKTFYKEDGHYRLQPENDTMDPIIVKDVQILGKVRALFRPTIF